MGAAERRLLARRAARCRRWDGGPWVRHCVPAAPHQPQRSDHFGVQALASAGACTSDPRSRPAPMAPRSRARAVQAASSAAAAATIADLPDAVLEHCLGFLTLHERCAQCVGALHSRWGMPARGERSTLCSRRCRVHNPPHHLCRQRAALVSRRFAALCCSPELLREVEASARHSQHSLPALHSVTAWLERHGPHVRRFHLSALPARGDDAGGFAAALTACLEAAGAAGQLTELELFSEEVRTEWLAAMPSLRRLYLVGDALHISSAIGGLTALQSLDLAGDDNEMTWAAAGRLPTTITRLFVQADGAEQMPYQASRGTLVCVLMGEECCDM